jgi:hypothetical protein
LVGLIGNLRKTIEDSYLLLPAMEVDGATLAANWRIGAVALR